jgi:hypothetical protein
LALIEFTPPLLTIDNNQFHLVKITPPLFNSTKEENTYWSFNSTTDWVVITIQEDGTLEGLYSKNGIIIEINKGRILSETDLPIPFFPNCYPNDNTRRQLYIGIVIDDDKIRDVETIIAQARVVFLAQLNILLTIGRIEIIKFPCSTIPQLLEKFKQWNPPTPQSYWHLLTNCNPPPGTVGIADLNSLCRGGRAISNKASWLIFAHELGHILGATHSFENGTGHTGGIMDYGSPYYNNVIQFNPSKRIELCSGLTRATIECPSNIFISSLECGNGIVEPGEQCECLKPNCIGCVNCKTNQECSTDFIMSQTSDPQCCHDGKFTTGKCNGADVCVNGKCTRFCSKYGLNECGMDDCSQSCLFNNQCSNQITTQKNIPISHLPDGLKCNDGGVCINGTCTKQKTCPYKNIKQCPKLSKAKCLKYYWRCSYCNNKCIARTPNRCKDPLNYYNNC